MKLSRRRMKLSRRRMKVSRTRIQILVLKTLKRITFLCGNSGKTINSLGCPLGFTLGTSLGIDRLSFIFHRRILYNCFDPLPQSSFKCQNFHLILDPNWQIFKTYYKQFTLNVHSSKHSLLELVKKWHPVTYFASTEYYLFYMKFK